MSKSKDMARLQELLLELWNNTPIEFNSSEYNKSLTREMLGILNKYQGESSE